MPASLVRASGCPPEMATPGEPFFGLPTGFILRPMTVWDIPEVIRAESTLFPGHEWTVEAYHRELAQAGSSGTKGLDGREVTRDYRVVVRVSNSGCRTGGYCGEIVGYAGMMAIGDTADVQTIGTLPHAQNQGIGAAQMRWMIAEARRRGAARLMLEVRESNAAARRLYARFGFDYIHTRNRYYPGGENALVLQARLADGSL